MPGIWSGAKLALDRCGGNRGLYNHHRVRHKDDGIKEEWTCLIGTKAIVSLFHYSNNNMMCYEDPQPLCLHGLFGIKAKKVERPDRNAQAVEFSNESSSRLTSCIIFRSRFFSVNLQPLRANHFTFLSRLLDLAPSNQPQQQQRNDEERREVTTKMGLPYFLV